MFRPGHMTRASQPQAAAQPLLDCFQHSSSLLPWSVGHPASIQYSLRVECSRVHILFIECKVGKGGGVAWLHGQQLRPTLYCRWCSETIDNGACVIQSISWLNSLPWCDFVPLEHFATVRREGGIFQNSWKLSNNELMKQHWFHTSERSFEPNLQRL